MDLSWPALRESLSSPPLLLRAIPVGMVIAAGVLATTWTHDLLSHHQGLVVHTYEVIDTTKDVLIGLDDAETGQRGYLLSGDRRYLDPYLKALDRLSKLQAALRTGISDNADQVSRVAELDSLVAGKLGELATSIRLRDTQTLEVVRSQELVQMQKATMDAIRHVIGEITQGERALLAARQVQVDDDEGRIRLVAIAVAVASFLTRIGVELYLATKARSAG